MSCFKNEDSALETQICCCSIKSDTKEISLNFLVSSETLPKAKRTRGLSSAYQNNFFCHIKVLAQILIKFHLQNIDQASTSKSQPNLSISTKLKLQNLNQT